MFKPLILLVLLVSCAWSGKEFFAGESESKSEEAIKQFDFDDQMLEKFSTQDAPKTEPVKELTPKQSKSTAETKSIVQNKKIKKAVAAKKVVTKKKETSEKNIKVKQKNIYPEDYPEEFKKYDISSKKIYEKFKPFVPIGEKMVMDISYLGVTVGSIKLTVMPMNKMGGQDVFHFHARMKSAPFYSYVYELDDVVESFVDSKSFLPLKYSLVQRESKQSIDDIQLFDRDALKTYFRMKKIKEEVESKRSIDTYIPLFSQDALSALFFIRGLPLKVGDSYKFPIVTRGKVTIMSINVAKVENINTSIGNKKAFRLEAVTHYSGDLVKKGNMIYWISADENRSFLKFDAEIKLGSVSGLIQGYTPGKVQ